MLINVNNTLNSDRTLAMLNATPTRNSTPLPLAPAIAGAHICAMIPDLIDPAELDAYDAWVAEHLDEMV
jgi:hypothetical protein